MDDLAVEQSLLAKLGARGWGRIHHFRNHYNQPWGERQAAPVSPRALDSLARFVAAASFPAGKLPSVFLTDTGGLELCWEDAAGSARQIEQSRPAPSPAAARTHRRDQRRRAPGNRSDERSIRGADG